MPLLRVALSVLAGFFVISASHADNLGSCNLDESKDYSKAEVDAADKALNAQYKKTRETLEKAWSREGSYHPEESAVDTLVAAQRAWIAYRDAECKLTAKSFDGGTAYSMIGLDCIGKLTEKRSKELEYIAENFSR